MQKYSHFGHEVFNILGLLGIPPLCLFFSFNCVGLSIAFRVGLFFYLGDGLGRSPDTFRENLAANLFLDAPVIASCFYSAGVERISGGEQFPSRGNLVEFTLGIDQRSFVRSWSKDVCCIASGWLFGG